MHFEDIHVGDHVAIVTTRKKRDRMCITGVPLKVLATSAPFILVTDNRETWPLDTRWFGFTKVNEDYVAQSSKISIEDLFGGESYSEDESSVYQCPKCKSTLTQERHKDSPNVFQVCNSCGYREPVF